MALGDVPCSFCKKHPARSSAQLIKDLPRKEQGGLFYGVCPDPKHAGHNKTFLQLIKEKPKILPDGDILDAHRCEVEGCLYVFKSNADSVRHMKIIHEKQGQEAHPMGFTCHFIVDGTACGMKFNSQWFLTRHKNETGHKFTRKRTPGTD